MVLVGSVQAQTAILYQFTPWPPRFTILAIHILISDAIGLISKLPSASVISKYCYSGHGKESIGLLPSASRSNCYAFLSSFTACISVHSCSHSVDVKADSDILRHRLAIWDCCHISFGGREEERNKQMRTSGFIRSAHGASFRGLSIVPPITIMWWRFGLSLGTGGGFFPVAKRLGCEFTSI